MSHLSKHIEIWRPKTRGVCLFNLLFRSIKMRANLPTVSGKSPRAIASYFVSTPRRDLPSIKLRAKFVINLGELKQAMSHITVKPRLVKVLREQYIKEALNATDAIVVHNMIMNARYTIQKMTRLWAVT